MNAIEVTSTLRENRNQVIVFFNENCKDDKFYTLSWFMNRVLVEATASWARRKNVGEKEVLAIILVAIEFIVVIHLAKTLAKLVTLFIYEYEHVAFNFERPVY